MGEASPSRPSGVPVAARWSESDGEWQLSALDSEGRLDGPFRSWRPDGSLRTIARHHAGKQVDVAWRFHPDGSLFSVGAFADGAPRGVHRRYANHDEAAERLQSCCVPAGAWQLRQNFRADGGAERSWFDREGVRLLDSGTPYPDAPAGVPATAWFNEKTETWEAGVSWTGDGLTGTRRRWSPAGVLQLIETLVGSKRQGLVTWFDAGGAPVCDAEYDGDLLSGSFRGYQVEENYFADPSVAGYRGTFVRNQAVGAWHLLRKDGADDIRLDLGVPSSDETLAAVLADQFRPAGQWEDLAASLLASGHVAESLLATARAAAATNDATNLRAALAKHVLALHPDAARTSAAELVARATEDVVALADGLRRGWEASELLLAIAKALSNSDRAALDLATAATVLAPEASAALATRALLRGSLGDPAASRRDIEALRSTAPEKATFLELYLRAYFPTFDFWPARELAADAADGEGHGENDDGSAGQAIASYRTVEEVREVVRRYATRLARLRALIEARVAGANALALPDPSPLLGEGPADLRRFTFTMSASEYGGEEESNGAAIPDGGEDAEGEAEVIEIAVDETAGLDLDGAPLLRILRRTRADWAGLVWLCWAVGLDRVAFPSSIAPPPAFGRQAMEAMQRAWRCRDKLNTSGLLALTKGIPGFDWEGEPIDLVPAALAEVTLEEYLERRAVFAWLCDPANRSPWQDDLRGD